MAKYRSRRYYRRRSATPIISPEVSQGLGILFLLAVSGVSIFSLLGLAGPFGIFWERILFTLFGWGVWLFPAFLIALSALSLRPPEERPKGVITFGIILALLSLSAFLDSFIPLETELRRQLEGQGGGYVGLFLRFPLETVFGFWASVLIIVSLFIASLLLIFDMTLGVLFGRMFGILFGPWQFVKDFFWGLFGWEKPADADYEDDEEAEVEIEDEEETERKGWRAFVPVFSRHNTTDDEEAEVETDDEKEAEEEEVGQISLPGTSAIAGRRKFKPVAIDLPLTLLNRSSDKPTSGDLKANKLLIKRTLENFGIPVEMGAVSVGPTVTQYTLKPEDGVKLSAITALSNDLSLALAAHPIRIEAPIPGRALVGIEVPNRAVARVQLRDILESELFQKRASNLMIGLGKDVAGSPWIVDLERMPHLLVAGSTGSGKSVALNSIILSLLYQNNPADLKFILIDPKRVEFSVYQHMPHLLTPIITAVPATVNALKWLLGEMDRRFDLLSSAGSRNIQAYNQKSKDKLPYIILVIDELADIMVAASSEVEASIIRLAQMSRAVGIHLILATQRPSVDVITGLIKANITARVAFSVASITDSRTILDSGGAEKLLGRGDLLYVSSAVPKPKRLQGAYVAEDEIKEVVLFLKEKATPEYISEVTEKPHGSSSGFGEELDDPLYGEAETLIISSGKASASFLQRRLKVGYARAARLLDILEAREVVGPGDGAKPREVLMSPEERDMLDDNNDEENDDNNEEE